MLHLCLTEAEIKAAQEGNKNLVIYEESPIYMAPELANQYGLGIQVE